MVTVYENAGFKLRPVHPPSLYYTWVCDSVCVSLIMLCYDSVYYHTYISTGHNYDLT